MASRVHHALNPMNHNSWCFWVGFQVASVLDATSQFGWISTVGLQTLQARALASQRRKSAWCMFDGSKLYLFLWDNLQIGFILRYLSRRIHFVRLISFWAIRENFATKNKLIIKSFSSGGFDSYQTDGWNRMKQFELGSLSPIFLRVFLGSVMIGGLDCLNDEDWKMRFCQESHDWNHSVFVLWQLWWFVPFKKVSYKYQHNPRISSHSSIIARNNGANDPINIVLWNGLWLKITPLFIWIAESERSCVNSMDEFVQLSLKSEPMISLRYPNHL